ncbi:MAG TPA: DAK2 domain-containing protein, partial [Pseudonocardiaceae bacterium]|nr:DAK2 domain-containing protein [Pseudonocardiaceae bacterium]
MACGTAGVVAALTAAADTVTAHRDELVELDRVIGDGDHGENLQRGFRTFMVAIGRATPDKPGAVLKLLATTLISTVGGAAGPLYGTACLRAAASIGDADELTADTVVAALKAALG